MAIGTPTAITAATFAATTTITTTVDAPAGSLILVFCEAANLNLSLASLTCSDNAAGGTNVYTRVVTSPQSASNYSSAVFACINSGFDVPIGRTITLAGTNSASTHLASYIVSGCNGGRDKAIGVNTSSGLTFSQATGSLNAANEIIFALGNFSATIPSWTESAGFTNLVNPNTSGGYLLAYDIVSSASSVTYNPSWTTTNASVALCVTSFEITGAITTPVALSGAGGLTIGTKLQAAMAASLTGVGTLTTQAAKLIGPISFPAVGTLTSTVAAQLAIAAALNGVGTLNAAPAELAVTNASLTGVGTLFANPLEETFPGAALTGVGTLIAALAEQAALGTALSATGTLTTAVVQQLALAAALSGTGSLSANALEEVFDAPSLSGSGALAAALLEIAAAGAALSGAGAFIANPVVQIFDGAVFTASGGLTIQSAEQPVLALTLIGNGILSATALSEMFDSPILAASGSLIAQLAEELPAGAILSAFGTLSTSTGASQILAAALTGVGTLYVDLTVVSPSPPPGGGVRDTTRFIANLGRMMNRRGG